MRHHSTIRSYAELSRWVAKFVSGDIHSLVIFGDPGLGKSETVRRAIDIADKHSVVINGRLSAYNLFHRLSADPGALFVFDDTRALLKDRECVNILMQLCENKPTKTIQWNTGKEACEPLETTSRALILINELDKSKDLEPIFSRSICINFAPSKVEVHNHVGTWFPTDARRREIYEYIGSNLHLCPSSDIRDYVKSVAVYDLAWKTVLVEAWSEDPDISAVLQVMADPLLTTVAEQVAAYTRMTGKARATFFRHRDRLQPMRHAGEGETVRLAEVRESLTVSPDPEHATPTEKASEEKSKKGKARKDWPPIDELVRLVREHGYAEMGRRLGCSDVAVRKHVMKHAPAPDAKAAK